MISRLPQFSLCFLGVFCFNARAISLKARVEEQDRSDRSVLGCTRAARERARTLIEAQDWKALEGHCCVHNDTVQGMKAGTEDAADAVEFLGQPPAWSSWMKQAFDGASKQAKAIVPPKNPDLDPDDLKYTKGSKGRLANEGCVKTLRPNIFYIGVGHSGSTSLADQMESHPDLSYGDMKEHNLLYKYDYRNKTEWLNMYDRQFRVPCSVKQTFDSSPRVLFLGLKGDVELSGQPLGYRGKGGAKGSLGVEALTQVKELVGPAAKFVLMFRDPLPWMMSNGMKPNLEKMLEWGGLFPHRSCYADALENWLQVFPKENFLFLSSNDFFADPQSILDQTFDFVGVPRRPMKEQIKSGRRRNYYNTNKFMKSMVQTTVAAPYYKNARVLDCMHRLEKITGLTLNWNGSSMD